ncbi:scavenger receptor cysteine-rich type 1 protein M130-like [Polyodon spathula]|uniref:scavenger receptor cysteine-rich type 1 protein M130-like n=1 Tax=Polyodon spathula TaxID=7913 RepID=UPI001B7E28CD|nr:scavenger receptor cysteine-rich type 1 protein M130-like [Polyodon spathula]
MDSEKARKVCADLRCGKLKSLDPSLDEKETGLRTTWNLTKPINATHLILQPAVCAQGRVAKIHCQNSSFSLSVRVKGKASRCSGSVEVSLNGEYWFPVCPGKQWDWERTSEVCRSVGCGEVKEFRAGGIRSTGISCPRGVPLSNCKGILTQENSCSPVEISCEVTPSLLPVRLSGSDAARCSGIVEVSLSGSWRGLCGEGSWSLKTAFIICQELNCKEALDIQPAWIRNNKQIQGVSCPNNMTILQCQDHLEERTCMSPDSWYIAVTAGSSPELAFRLTDGWSKCAGNVSVLHRGTFQPVCTDSWSQDSANTACQQLNCGRAKSITLNGSAEGKVRSGLYCSQNWTGLQHCGHFLKTKSCSQALVICTGHKEVFEVIESKTGQTVKDLICYVLSAAILIIIAIKCGPQIYQKILKKVFRKNEREWIGPTQSQSVSFHRNRNALQPGPRPCSGPKSENEYTATPTSKRHSPAYPALERMMVNITSENSSAGNSEYDFY